MIVCCETAGRDVTGTDARRRCSPALHVQRVLLELWPSRAVRVASALDASDHISTKRAGPVAHLRLGRIVFRHW